MELSTATRRAPGRPRDEALQQRRRTEILDCAVRVFAKHGYQQTDVQVIADDVGISKGSVYRYFESKEGLFLAAVRRGVQELFDTIDARLAAVQDGLETLSLAVSVYIEFFQRRPELTELFVQERATFRERRLPVFFDMRDARRDRWVRIVKRLISECRVRKIPPARLLDVLGNALYGTMFTNHFIGNRKPVHVQAAEIIDVLFNGILVEKEVRR